MLNSIFGSLNRWPTFQVIIWNPNRTTMNQLADGTATDPGKDISPWVESAAYQENNGYENANNPRMTSIRFNFKRGAVSGQVFRRGLIEDGVLVRVLQGDARVEKSEWIPIFTGTFRGRPGDNPGVPATTSEGLQAVAHGREERFLNLQVTTKEFPVNTDLGEMFMVVANRNMGLGQDEILVGAQGFETKHITNQLVDINALQALWELLFPVGKKPKFDALGRLVAVDVNLDKPAIKVQSAGNLLQRSQIAAPNDVEVNNLVAVRGLNADLTRVIQEFQRLITVQAVTGYFDSEFEEDIYYSEDRTQRAQDTFVNEKKKIKWSGGDWTEIDEFHGQLVIDTRFLRNARVIIFTTYLTTTLAVALLDLFMDEVPAAANTPVPAVPITTVAVLKFILEILAQVALAALLWSMNFIGRGVYEVHGKPFENVYQEIVSEAKLTGLTPEAERRAEFRNDFISDITTLDVIAKERLRRELVKNQLFVIELLDDPQVEVDDVIEDKDGQRFYVVSVSKTLKFGEQPIMRLTCWKIFDAATAAIEELELAASV